ncbi:MAG TPA: sugar ABC transporter ATP-binding protein [Novosphingobium sp.]
MLLDARAISKAYPGVVALDSVSLAIRPGEVHALLGENGAGKSTLLKILAGAQTADSGTVALDGTMLSANDTPFDRQRAGIVTIYQEFNLIPEMSVAENMFLGREPCRFGMVAWPVLHARAKAVLDGLGLALDPRMPVRSLSVAEQQMVEIAKAMTFDARLIIMDEPTAALSDREVAALHAIIRDLRARGISIIYVTHRLAEVFAICDRYTVLRDGRRVAEGELVGLQVDDLVRQMVGRDVLVARRQARAQPGAVALRVENVRRSGTASDPTASVLRDISLDVHAGEILGFAGLVGAGRTELARIIFGADRTDSGVIWLDGQRRALLASPREGISHGIALVPEDRKQQGCFLDHSVRQNLTLPSLRRLSRWRFFIDGPAERAMVESYRASLRVKMAGQSTPIGQLSGGNQQKVLLARCMALAPKVLIVDEPTRGIDIGAKSEVHEVLATMAAEGVAVIVISSELPEVMAVSDRIVVFREGAVTGIVAGADASEEQLMQLMAVGDPRADPGRGSMTRITGRATR